MRLSLCLSVRKIQIFLQLMCLASSTKPQQVPTWNPAHDNVNSFVLIIRPNSCHPTNLLNSIKLNLLQFVHSLDSIISYCSHISRVSGIIFGDWNVHCKFVSSFCSLTNVCLFCVAGSQVLISLHLLLAVRTGFVSISPLMATTSWGALVPSTKVRVLYICFIDVTVKKKKNP